MYHWMPYDRIDGVFEVKYYRTDESLEIEDQWSSNYKNTTKNKQCVAASFGKIKFHKTFVSVLLQGNLPTTAGLPQHVTRVKTPGTGYLALLAPSLTM